MPKTAFTKGQLVQIHSILREAKLLPCEKISVFTDIYNSGIYKYSIIHFVKGRKQLKIGFVTRTYPKNEKLSEQLYEYFGKEKNV